MRKDYYSYLINRIIDEVWAIKMKYPKYKPQENLKFSIVTLMSFTIRESNGEKINGMIYYSYLLYLGCMSVANE